MRNGENGRFVQSPVIAVLDIFAKVVLLAFVTLVAIDPSWGNLVGKAPNVRALTYPLLAFALPLWWTIRRPDSPFPWLADLLLTYVGFSDVLGNRLDLYDRVVWFDDWMHVVNTGCLTAAMVLVTTHRTESAIAVLERAIAFGMTVAVGWELFEYASFVTRSSELPTAYADTISDLVLGWCGTVLAAMLVHYAWRHHMPEREGLTFARLRGASHVSGGKPR